MAICLEWPLTASSIFLQSHRCCAQESEVGISTMNARMMDRSLIRTPFDADNVNFEAKHQIIKASDLCQSPQFPVSSLLKSVILAFGQTIRVRREFNKQHQLIKLAISRNEARSLYG